MQSELDQKCWAVVYHNGVHAKDMTHKEAFQSSKQLRHATGMAATVVTNAVAEKILKEQEEKKTR